MTPDEFRELALRIPEAEESEHMDHPDFRLGGKIFASLGVPDDDWGMVKLTPEEQRDFIQEGADIFKPCNGAWGRQGCTCVHLGQAKKGLVQRALKAAAKNVAARAKPKGRTSRRRA